jgi:hypothetical protein
VFTIKIRGNDEREMAKLIWSIRVSPGRKGCFGCFRPTLLGRYKE